MAYQADRSRVRGIPRSKSERGQADSAGRGNSVLLRPSTASATPPMMAVPETSKRSEAGSASRNTPAVATSAGTASCTMEARVALNPRKAAYQRT